LKRSRLRIGPHPAAAGPGPVPTVRPPKGAVPAPHRPAFALPVPADRARRGQPHPAPSAAKAECRGRLPPAAANPEPVAHAPTTNPVAPEIDRRLRGGSQAAVQIPAHRPDPLERNPAAQQDPHSAAKKARAHLPRDPHVQTQAQASAPPASPAGSPSPALAARVSQARAASRGHHSRVVQSLAASPNPDSRASPAARSGLKLSEPLCAAEDLRRQLPKLELLVLTDDCGRKDAHDHREYNSRQQ